MATAAQDQELEADEGFDIEIEDGADDALETGTPSVKPSVTPAEKQDDWLDLDDDQAPAKPVAAKPEDGDAAAAEGADDPDDDSQYSEAVRKRIAKLTAKRRESERQLQAAIEYGRSVTAERDQYRQRMEVLDKGYVGEYENRVNAQIDMAKSAYQRAIDNHDTAAQVESQSRLQELNSEKQQVSRAKAQREQALQHSQQQPGQPVQQPTYQQPAAQPQAAQPDPKAVAWAEKNEWFGQDRVLTSTAMAVHAQMVNDEGFDPLNAPDDYYRELDKRMARYNGSSQGAANSTQGRRPASAVAGVNRGGATTGRQRVRLTKSQVAIAKELGVPIEKYAAQVAAQNERGDR